MTAAERLAALDQLPAEDIFNRTNQALTELVDVMNRETTLLRAGKLKEAGALSAEKASRAQDYTVLARAVQRATPRLETEAPEMLRALRGRHESLATQMAENLKVLAISRNLTETLINDVAAAAAKTQSPQTYSAGGAVAAKPPQSAKGLSLNRAL